MVHEVKVEVGGKTLTLQSGLLAKQANGSVFATYEGATVIATACCSASPNTELDFIPLQVEYNEKYYAAGKIPGGFLKREARPKDKEILVSRLIDRPMRPLFFKNFMREIQIVPTVLSTDKINPPDIVAMTAASAAVMISDIPFDGPMSALRIAYVDDEFIINPTFEQVSNALMEIVVAGTEEGITMVEGGGKEIGEDILIEALERSRDIITRICHAQRELVEKCGKEKLPLLEVPKLEIADELKDFAREELTKACFIEKKESRAKTISEVCTKSIEHFQEQDKINENNVSLARATLEDLVQEIIRTTIIKENRRVDGRTPTDIRDIQCQVGLIPRTHGCALFTRGETQALAFVTLGTTSDEQIHDDIEGDRRERFLLHYNFPPYSVGETGRLGTGRREIGHGYLAFRAVTPLIPPKEEFPYTIRIVSEVLESNGSSSMATVCASSMALMDAGIQIPQSIGGIAMGLIKEEDATVILSDILGDEDHVGDMDFKVAGTKKGITAFQMDIKIKNIDHETMQKALHQAKEGRLHIIETMEQTIQHSRQDLSKYAPRILTVDINPENIGLVIGSGGKTIRALSEKFGVEINIDDSGTVTILGRDAADSEKAKNHILQLMEEPEVGKEYTGIVKRITNFGAFIEILPGKDGLCHISKLSDKRVNSVEDVLKINEEVQVRITEIDRLGRINLAMVTILHVKDKKYKHKR